MDDGIGEREALATVRAHQERARRAARVPWWVYVAMFVLGAGVMAANDFVDLSGTKVISLVVLVALVVTVVTTFVTRSAPLSRLRGVQRRQSFHPRVFGTVILVAVVGGGLLSRYGSGFVRDVAAALGLSGYPNTVTGVLYGAAFTLLFALSQGLTTLAQRRTGP